MERRAWVYLLASRRNGTLYLGVTNDLDRRVSEHRQHEFSGFTSKYGVTRLVWCEHFPRIDDAIATEKRLKRWRRAWKIALIERQNPNWDDLADARRVGPVSAPQR
jgi:putative endonuclease